MLVSRVDSANIIVGTLQRTRSLLIETFDIFKLLQETALYGVQRCAGDPVQSTTEI